MCVLYAPCYYFLHTTLQSHSKLALNVSISTYKSNFFHIYYKLDHLINPLIHQWFFNVSESSLCHILSCIHKHYSSKFLISCNFIVFIYSRQYKYDQNLYISDMLSYHSYTSTNKFTIFLNLCLFFVCSICTLLYLFINICPMISFIPHYRVI